MAGGVPEAVKHMGMFEISMSCTVGFPQSCSWLFPSLVPDGAGGHGLSPRVSSAFLPGIPAMLCSVLATPHRSTDGCKT